MTIKPINAVAIFIKFLCIAWLAGCVAIAMIGWMTEARDREQKVDMALVLGNQVYADGSPSDRLSARLDRALQCYEHGLCHLIFVSGGIDKAGTDEALAMKRYLLARGVSDNQIIVDNQGRNTWASAQHGAEFMRRNDLRSVLVVSQYFHIPRAMLALDRHGVLMVAGACPKFGEARDIYSLVREVPAVIWYAIRPLE